MANERNMEFLGVRLTEFLMQRLRQKRDALQRRDPGLNITISDVIRSVIASMEITA